MNMKIVLAVLGLLAVVYVLLIEQTREYTTMTLHGDCALEELGGGEVIAFCRNYEVFKHLTIR